MTLAYSSPSFTTIVAVLVSKGPTESTSCLAALFSLSLCGCIDTLFLRSPVKGLSSTLIYTRVQQLRPFPIAELAPPALFVRVVETLIYPQQHAGLIQVHRFISSGCHVCPVAGAG
ncbi:hypothetical protein FGO68_gene7811 [Halteria grandinella]|uniref:Uncharacterized protein n=1 Tax=Halteria grandinella TaxID=5974 RepID=A0A8J8SZY1_HALGN|nr:hypothetical protein FGO68_gene7811 [Halteria grandinella]